MSVLDIAAKSLYFSSVNILLILYIYCNQIIYYYGICKEKRVRSRRTTDDQG